LDIPLVNDTDDENGFYAAMAGHESTAWRGAELDKSTDGGATYAAVANDAVIDPMGTTTDALGDWSGGNVFDMLNTVTVVIGAGGGTLSSASALGVLNGANEAVIGQELVQFVTAELIATSTYKLSGLLRGRRGTEWAMPAHLAGDRFALLPVTNVPAAFAELGNARKYKAVTSRTTLAAATAQTFTNNGQALRPYSPVLLGGAPITPFDGTVELHWIRRTRKGGAWNDFTEVPVSEAAEQYVVQIWNATYSLCARIITVSAQSATYTAAQQVTDFGATQQHIYWTVGQLGLYQLGTQSAAVSPGSGGSDNAPLSPIPPYNSAPPPPSRGLFAADGGRYVYMGRASVEIQRGRGANGNVGVELHHWRNRGGCWINQRGRIRRTGNATRCGVVVVAVRRAAYAGIASSGQHGVRDFLHDRQPVPGHLSHAVAVHDLLLLD
jgi:hypothetical protein